jgi:GNAT superfamily N-acetyltransferase
VTAPAIPDEPRWVEASAILASGEHWLDATGRVIGHDASALMVALPGADADAVVALAAARPRWSILAAPERDDLRAALTAIGWAVERAHIHTLPDAGDLPDDEGAVVLPGGTDLGHLPAALAGELAAAQRRGAVWTAVVDGAPVCFAFAPWRSARWFDVSVDTLPGYRQLGLGTRVAAALIRDERRRGREPVWGALDGNAASLRLAARLGFVAIDALWVAMAP